MGASKQRKKGPSHKTILEDKEDEIYDKRQAKEGKKEHCDSLFSDEEIKALGLPLKFASSKGKQVQKNPVEAARIGQVRQYQRFGRKKLTQWQVEHGNKRIDENKLEE